MTYNGSVLALGLTILVAAPAAAQTSSKASEPAEDPATHATVRGRVQSSHEERIVVTTDDGRTITVNAKAISETTRGLVQKDEPIIVTGPLTGSELEARSLTVAATAPGARAMAGQPPFLPEEPSAASPFPRDQPRR
jgi:hypothetical protein